MERIMIVVAGLILSFSSHAGIAEKLNSCSAILKDSSRLVCFDSVVVGPTFAATKAIDTALAGINKSGLDKVSLAVRRKIEVALLKKQFGQETWKSNKHEINTIVATISKVDKTAYGKNLIALSNQQVWRQVSSKRFKLRVDDEVTLSRGTLNAFFISKQGSSREEKFARIR